uniref:Uncharacterized protein LOC111105689 n=1 Tax=Crassostrea virginica TaxID=6565 RepID=A0A8B8AX03_CRAVI|nr:uncharacterized protein LOC111105689 [Crassostrea virginica]
MDSRYCAQDVLRCDLCETPVPPMYCDICHIKLCIPCVGIHISDRSKKHEVVPFEERGSTIKYPNCKKHSSKKCELHCEQCDIPICAQCVSSIEHRGHKLVEIMEVFTSKKESIKKDLKEIEEFIYPKYQQAAANIPVQRANAKTHSTNLTTELKKQGEAVHKEIDTAIQKMQSEIDDMDSKHLAMIEKQEKAINYSISEIKQAILDLRKLLDTSDLNLLSDYKSRNEEFRTFPAQFQVILPVFTPQEINRNQILQQLGSLSKLDITTQKPGSEMKYAGAESSPSFRPLIDEPRIVTEINTEYGKENGLRGVSCLSDSELWTCGKDNILRLYNLQGKLLKSELTISGNAPWDIAVTQSRDLVYTDPTDRSINIVTKTQIQPLIRLLGWLPLYLCSTFCGDLLAIMISEDRKQSKVVRYSGSTEKQSIQWDDQGKPLFSSEYYSKYLSENKNFDICVTDNAAGAVVVVSASGKLRFRYTGPPSTTKKQFKPNGITTDSHSRILTTDENFYIHILDKDGCLLRFIVNYGLQIVVGICVDSRDNLFVAEFDTGKVKKIQYYK